MSFHPDNPQPTIPDTIPQWMEEPCPDCRGFHPTLLDWLNENHRCALCDGYWTEGPVVDTCQMRHHQPCQSTGLLVSFTDGETVTDIYMTGNFIDGEQSMETFLDDPYEPDDDIRFEGPF